MKTFTLFPISPTRFRLPALYNALQERVADECNIYYGKQPNVGWRFVVENDSFSVCGAIYKTKAELLADLPAYAAQWANEWR